MPKFSYVTRDQEAHLITGAIEAKEMALVEKSLKKKNLVIISITEEKEEKKSRVVRGAARIKPMDLVIFSRQLATLIDSGISLVMGLTILQEQIENVYLRRIVTELKGDIEGGNSLSSSFAKHPNVFPAIFSNMIKAGESSGSLNEILERVADYLERTEGVKHKLKSALTYPALIIGMAIIIVGFLILKVVPAFKNIFESLGGSLPLPTLFLIQFSNLSIRLFPLIVIASIIIVAAFKRYVSTETGRLRFDQFKLKIPIFGPVLRNMAISKFTRTLATLVKSGVSILEAFEIAGKVAGNKIIEQATYQIRVDLQAGESISEPMAQTGKFPVFVVKMIAVGEQTGELEKMLSKVSDYYEEQINEALNSLTAMLEPVIILFLGSVIGFIVLAMFLPIFKLTQTIAH